MKNLIITILILITGSQMGFSQLIFTEDFESMIYPNLPVNWTTTSLDINGGFYTGDADSARLGRFWVVEDHTSFVMANDDVCLCNASDDYLISPSINLSAYTGQTIFLQFDAWMEDFWQGKGMIKVDTGTGWIDVYDIPATPNWQTRVVNLSQFSNATNFKVAFHFNDEGAFSLGLAIDDISIFVPSNQFDAAIYEVKNTYSDYLKVPFSQLTPITLSSTIYNNGKDTLTGVMLIVESSQTSYLDTFFVGNISPAEYVDVEIIDKWNITTSIANSYGVFYSIKHDSIDNVPTNNNQLSIVEVTDSLMAKEDGSIGDAQIPLAGETIAQAFTVFKQDTITSISLNLLLADNNDSLQFLIYTMNGDLPDSIIYASEIFTSLTQGWTTYQLANEVILDTGFYAIGVEKYGQGITGLTASTSQYIPNTTFSKHFSFVTYFWYNDEQSYLGALAYHHTYLLRPNFGSNSMAVGIDELGYEKTFDIYPNPSTGVVNLNVKEKIEKIEIYNITGKLVYQNSSNQKQLDLSYLDGGIYFIKIKVSDNWITKKLIIE